jgi:fumarate hydratase class I
MAEFAYEDLLPIGADETPYRKLSDTGVRTGDARHRPLPAPGHLQQLRNILDDPEASDNDRFVALDLLKNANISAGGVLPMCQDTGTAIVKGKKGQFVLTGGGDERAIAPGVHDTYTEEQPALLARWRRSRCTTRRTPAPTCRRRSRSRRDRRRRVQVPLHGQGRRLGEQELPVPGDQGAAQRGDVAVPGSSTRSKTLGTAACPPYHLAVVIGGTSAEFAVETAKLASRATSTRCRPRGRSSATASATSSWRPRCSKLAADRHRRPVRRQVLLPRRARHPPAAPRRELPGRDRGVSARPTARRSARSPRGRVPRATRDRSGSLPARCRAPHLDDLDAGAVVQIDLNRPMAEIRAELSKYPVKTRVMLTGPMVVARDIAHAKIKERLDAGEGCRST